MVEAEEKASGSTARRLIAVPSLLQDWDSEGEEQSARYWELFVDLLLVATASVVADGLKEDPTREGIAAFCCLYFIFLFGWNTYVHVTTRFDDPSLLHSFNLFFFLLGMASCVMNADGFENVRGFAISAAVQRAALLMMMVPIAYHIPRARAWCLFFSSFIAFGLLCFVISAVLNTSRAARILWWLTVVVESNMELFGVMVLRGRRLVPINIEHNVERMGCFVLVMLGETVLSVTLNYRASIEEHPAFDPKDYYIVMVYCFLLIFMFALLYFHMQPARQDHAFRRSRQHGVAYLLAFKFLGLFLLSIGVGVKLVVEAVVDDEPLTEFGSKLIGISVGAALTSLFILRLLNYGGKLPRPSDPPDVKRLMIGWWVFVAIAASVVPYLICFILVFFGWRDPIHTVGIYACLIAVLVIVETSFSHVLTPHLAKPITEEEEKPLVQQTMPEEYKTFPLGQPQE